MHVTWNMISALITAQPHSCRWHASRKKTIRNQAFWDYFENVAEPRLNKRAGIFRQMVEYMDVDFQYWQTSAANHLKELSVCMPRIQKDKRVVIQVRWTPFASQLAYT
jgi:hypothetical protein